MELINLITGRIDIFFLILARVSGIFTTAPIFSSRNLSVQLKAGLSGIIALIILPIIPVQEVHLATNLWSYAFMIAGELLLGLAIGFIAGFVFAAIQTAGGVMDMQIGFSMVNVIDPLFGTPVPLVGNFKYMLALLVFMATNSHHYVLEALVGSFKAVPLGNAGLSNQAVEMVIALGSTMFFTALKIAIPVTGSLLVAEIVLGLMARTVPQMNVFVVGVPGKIFFGLIMLIVTIPIFVFLLDGMFNQNYHELLRILSVMH